MSDDPQMQVLIANAISNAFASGAGALTDVAMGGNGLNGSSLASVMQAYNQSKDPNGGKIDETTQKVLSNLYDWGLNTMEAASYFPVIGDPASLALALMYAANGDYKNSLLNLAAAGVGVVTAGEGKIVVKGAEVSAEEASKLLAGNENDIFYSVNKETETKDGTSIEVTVKHDEKSVISPENEKYVDILSPEAKQHILYGDNLTSGGHLYPGNPGKTVFPESWSADKVVHEIGDITTSSNTKWYAQTGTGGIYTAKGKPANWVSYEVRDGVRIRVVYQPATGKVITAFPDNASIPNTYKTIK